MISLRHPPAAFFISQGVRRDQPLFRFVLDLCQKIADLDVLADLVRRKNSKLRGINSGRGTDSIPGHFSNAAPDRNPGWVLVLMAEPTGDMHRTQHASHSWRTGMKNVRLSFTLCRRRSAYNSAFARHRHFVIERNDGCERRRTPNRLIRDQEVA